MANKLISTMLFTSLISGMSTVLAEEAIPEPPRWFQVELIFFEPLESTATGEVWPEPEVKHEAINVEEIERIEQLRETSVTELTPPLEASSIQNPQAFQLLDPIDFSMTDISQKLLNSRQYRILSHIAWRQPTVKLADSRPIHVHDELMQEDALIPVTNEPLVLNNLPDPIEQLETGVEQKRFDGTVTVSLSRYLHLKADINYYNPEVYLAEQVAQQDIDAPTIEYFKLSESRRMRSKKVHYLDHPYFGIIALITPYKNEVQLSPTP